MLQAFAHEYDLPLRHVFAISRESTSVQPTLVVELTDGKLRGYGEATTNKYYGVTRQRMRDSLDRARPTLAATGELRPTELWSELNDVIGDDPFTLCAIDQAAHDLWGKQQGQPVYKLWGLSIDRTPVSDYTIGIDTIDKMVAKLREMPDWPIYKIKLGTPEDLEIVRALRRHTHATFRVDANCAWTADKTIAYSRELAELGVEFIEQPLPADDWEGAARVYRESELPIVADEACIREADVEKCRGRFHGVNIKLVKCGGLTPARRMIANARSLGMKTMVGCMTESTVGISAIAQLLPLLDFVDMDGAVLLARDVATGARVVRGRCIYPDAPGTGVELLPK